MPISRKRLEKLLEETRQAKEMAMRVERELEKLLRDDAMRRQQP